LALARSLKRAGLAVSLVTSESSSVSYSNAIRKVIRWAGASQADALAVFEDLAREHRLAGGILIPSGDPEVRLVAEAHARLSSKFAVMIPGWDRLQWACDKTLAYKRSHELGLGTPRVYDRALFTEPELGSLRYPLVLKPSMRLRINRFTTDRGWRVDDPNAFRRCYGAACELVGAEHVIVQELISGGGECQVSYAGLWNAGKPVIGFTARRLRQYPVEFGTTSTYVVTAHLPDVADAAETFLHSIGHHGLIEIEFKRDPRDGVLKLLDVNPRPWNWLALGEAAGIDFGAAIRSMMSNERVPTMVARPGVGWIFVSRDIVTAGQSGLLHPRAILGYAASWTRVRKSACFSWTDPIPAFVDLPLGLAHALQRRISHAPSSVPQPGSLPSPGSPACSPEGGPELLSHPAQCRAAPGGESEQRGAALDMTYGGDAGERDDSANPAPQRPRPGPAA
jgi:predicted ATP-grasp superfamily ATP-dependent carboligase